MRGVAKEVIEKRWKAKERGKDQHNDLLSHILLLPERDRRTTMNDMVDHFMSFVVGGKLGLSYSLTSSINHFIL